MLPNAITPCVLSFLFTKQATLTCFAMYSMVSKINHYCIFVIDHVILKWGHAVMDDIKQNAH